MIINSASGATVFYSLNLPEIGNDYWLPDQKILENEHIATSTTSAGFFRQLVKYSDSSIKKTLRVLLDNTRAATLEAMVRSTQTSWVVSVGTSVFSCYMVASLTPFGRNRSEAVIQLSVIEKVS